MATAPPPPRARPPLFDALPSLAATVPFLPLASAPTAVERCAALAPYLGRDDVWMKRDDLISPVYGGNKVRRYEFVLADAKARGAASIVTLGGLASTQVMATARFGQSLGLPVTAVLFDQPVTRFAREAILTDLDAGATLIYGGGYARSAWRFYQARRAPGAYVINPGAASPRANLGYVDAVLELAAQVERGEMPRPDVIVLPTGSSGTLAALALATAWLGWETEVVGVRITLRAACNALTIGLIRERTARWITARAPGFGRALGGRRGRYRLFHDAIGEGYGYPTAESVEAMEWYRALTGESGEVTYSAKALVGLRAVARDPAYAKKTILLWQTLSGVRPVIAEGTRERVPAELRWVFEGDVVA
ncbi:MAG: pyridoxal-phosphate dependent enzyme [Deltaproteobacteria bacterium]|nr:pyridoxal-phosphate dependent enzyme [Myxococcales bacterium]MDP3221405.1 pyridoxal-phosphate dependent enzyme [Deltaproteobacteria bacterium]